jgi:hypothetical protein
LFVNPGQRETTFSALSLNRAVRKRRVYEHERIVPATRPNPINVHNKGADRGAHLRGGETYAFVLVHGLKKIPDERLRLVSVQSERRANLFEDGIRVVLDLKGGHGSINAI